MSGSTVHTKIWADKILQQYGEAPDTDRPYRLTLLTADPHSNAQAGQSHPRPKPLLPAGVPSSIEFDAVGPLRLRMEDAPSTSALPRFSPQPGLRDFHLDHPEVGPGEILTVAVEQRARAPLQGVEAIELLQAVPLECELPFNWRPPLVFPPKEGGRREVGWFIVEASLKQMVQQEGGGLAVQLNPSSRGSEISLPEHVKPCPRSPNGWVPTILS